MVNSANIKSNSGEGEFWQATSYLHVNDTKGYVLWTHAGKGRAVLWEVDPSVPSTVPVLETRNIGPDPGTMWWASGYERSE